jgi:hypothetical protein
VNALRRLVPRPVRRGVSVQLAEMQARRLERDLRGLVAQPEVIVAGPWLGEVGFELLYWVPFLRWFAERFRLPRERLLVVSRGGTASWYQPFAAGYREIFDYLSAEEFRTLHDERVAANGEQKQTRVLDFEHKLLQRLTADVEHRKMLHPSSMYRLFSPFWWGHLDERWVHERASYARLAPVAAPGLARPDSPYTAVKFYFNECFPATPDNRAFARGVVRDLLRQGPVVSLTTGLRLDDHDGHELEGAGVQLLPEQLDVRQNLAVQGALVSGARAFVGTYGGFSYLAPFCGVPTTAYYSNPAGFSPRHLLMAHSALSTMGMPGLLSVLPRPGDQRPTHDPRTTTHEHRRT